jgi:integrase
VQRTVGRLSSRRVANAKPKGGREAMLLADGGNLYLQCTLGTDGNVRRSWLFRYERDGRRRDMGLGPLHTIGLADARDKARSLRQQLLEDIDPLDARRQRRADERLERAKQMSFGDCVEARHPRDRLEERQAPPAMADDAHDVLQLHFRSAGEGHRHRPRPARAHPAVGDAHRDGKAAARPHRAGAELGQRPRPAQRGESGALVRPPRTSETIGATWNEIDLKAKVWTVPAERMKAGKEHRIPLSDRTVEILTGLSRHGKRVFPLSNMAMLELLRGMRPGTTTHGFRSSFRTWASEATSFPHEVCEQALAHTISNKVERAYRRGDLFQKRTAMMQAWAAYCGKPAADGKVLPIRAARS